MRSVWIVCVHIRISSARCVWYTSLWIPGISLRQHKNNKMTNKVILYRKGEYYPFHFALSRRWTIHTISTICVCKDGEEREREQTIGTSAEGHQQKDIAYKFILFYGSDHKEKWTSLNAIAYFFPLWMARRQHDEDNWAMGGSNILY